MLLTFDADGRCFRVVIGNSLLTTGAGLTGLTFESAGLIVSTIADNEATATAYTQAGGTIETISTLGTYAAPTATKCRFKEVDATNHPGLYELHFANARLGVASAKELIVTVSGATNCVETSLRIELTRFDLQTAKAAATIAVGDLAANSITASALATDAVAEIISAAATTTDVADAVVAALP